MMKKMMAANKGKLFISSLLILLPALTGWVLKKEVYLLPFCLLAGHWMVLGLIFHDRKNKEQSKKIIELIFWTAPVSSLFISAVFQLAKAGGRAFSVMMVLVYFGLGLVFAASGNYLPKIRQNSTIGIKAKWALENEENWNATHRFAGKVWVAGGLFCMICGLFPDSGLFALLFMAAVIMIVFIPFFYSYLYYKKQVKAGNAKKNRFTLKSAVLTMTMVLLIAAFVVWVLFGGGMKIAYHETSFTVAAKGWKGLTVNYKDVESIEYQASDKASGHRTNGFGNLRFSMGSFENEIYGGYTRYTHASCDSCVVLSVNGEMVVINGPDDKSTKEIYQTLREKIPTG